MKINYNGKTIKKIDRRTRENALLRKGGKVAIRTKRRTRTQCGGSQIARVVIALAIVPMIASICSIYSETKQAMDTQHTEAVEDIPPAIKFEEMSVVEKSDNDNNETTKKETTESVEDKIKRIFPEDWELATAIFKAESGLRADAKGDTNTAYPSIGIAQIRMLPERGLNENDLYDVEYNLQYARHLKDIHGWTPWSAYVSGAYKKFIK